MIRRYKPAHTFGRAAMTRRVAKAKSAAVQWRPARFAVAAAALAALVAAPPPAGAAKRHAHRAVEAVAPRAAGTPIMAIVSLKTQQVTVYDADGWILRAPVSSGQRGRETPAGVFSVIQKERDHYSNLYDDAYMPHMQRVTWSGIALHGGHLPGHPASHGCVRMPYGFAERLFEGTQLGMRVIIAPGDPAPVEIAHPALFSPQPDAVGRAAAAAATAAANEAARKAEEARIAAVAAWREAARARMSLRTLENLKGRAAAELAAAETALGAAQSDEAKARAADTKTQAEAKVADLQARWDAAAAELQPKIDAVAPAREAAAAAERERAKAAAAAREAARELEPVSVFISRKTQRLYVRRGFEPVFDSPVTIRDPDQPIGTYVFTAVARTDAGLRWTVVAVNGAADAKNALDRIAIPQDALDRIAPTASPRSSLIISDEALSKETGKGTEFVAVLSNEPQGGLAMRRRGPSAEFRYARQRGYYWGAPYGGSYSPW
jgi:hypothetical protein